jgi:asparagine synthase (glutamine-hydrolysing)
MCGICGFVGRRNDDALAAMNAALIHRGPDGAGTYGDNELGVYLAHRRLVVIDRSGGAQPMASADDQIQVVYNGEIYNHLDLRAELTAKGHVFRSDHSDTEVLIHGYREWGPNLPKRLSGMFAFALLDRRAQRLVLARDRFAKKPLYYWQRGDSFAFASEVSALLKHPEIFPKTDLLALQKLFAYGFIPAPRSQYEGIKKLPGGSVLTYDLSTHRSTIETFWRFHIRPEDPDLPADEEEICEQLRELLSRAVRRRLIADVPLGILLSGGIDSSAILKFAAGHSTGPVSTFSIGFREKSFDETPFIDRMVAEIGTDHHHETMDLERARDLLPDVLGRMDEPLGDPSILPTYLVSQVARKHVTVALSGDGGDEMFAGYDPFKALALAQTYQRIVPKPLHRAIRLAAAWLPVSDRNMSLDFKIKRALRGLNHPPQLWNPVWLGALEPADIGELFQCRPDPEEIYSEAIDLWESSEATSLIDRTLEFYARLYLMENMMTKVDRAGMMNSLEIRSPFLDNDLTDFAARLPYRMKIRNGNTKHILKRALEGHLPTAILTRPKKGFGIPLSRWLRDLEPSARPRNLPGMDQAIQDRYWKRHGEKVEDHRHCLWNLLALDACLTTQTQSLSGGND